MNSELTPQRTWSDRAVALRDEEWQLHDECVALAREALTHYKIKGKKKLNIIDIDRLLSLADKLGRLATGMATDHVEHAWAQYHDPVFLAEIDREIEKVFGKCVDVTSEVTPVTPEVTRGLTSSDASISQNPPSAYAAGNDQLQQLPSSEAGDPRL